MSQSETENLPVLQLDVISDVICPWCFIGKRKLDAALENLKDVRINLMWRPYQLYPDTPAEGADLTAKIKQRYGEEGAKQMRENIKGAAEGTNINFAFDKIKITPNTLNAHRLIRWAASTGQQHMIAEALFSAHFEQGTILVTLPYCWKLPVCMAWMCRYWLNCLKAIMTLKRHAMMMRRREIWVCMGYRPFWQAASFC